MKPQAIEVRSELYGLVVYEKDGACGPCLPGTELTGAKLRVPFSDFTRDNRESLKALGFRCHHEERFWELPPAAYSRQREAQLVALLQSGELPTSPRSPMAASPRAAGPLSPRAAGHKHRRNGEVEVGPLSPTAAAAAATTAAAAFDAAMAAGGSGGGGAQPAAAVEQQEGELEDEDGELAVHVHANSAAHVVLRRGADGHLTLEGAGLWNIRPMLERILHFSEVPVAAGTAACPGLGAPTPRWRSAWPLNEAEAAFVEAVLEHRKRSLRNPRHDDHEPIPLGLVVPPRFRPRSRDGLAMRGPMLMRGGAPHNIGRQFFAPLKREGGGGILWADGTAPHIDEAQAQFNEAQLGELADREDWEEDVPTEDREADWGEAGGEEGVADDFFD